MRVKLQLVMCHDDGHEETITDVITLNKNNKRRKRNKKVAVSAVMICSPIRGTLEGALTSWTMSCASLSRRSLSAAKR